MTTQLSDGQRASQAEGRVDRFFEVTKRGSTYSREIIGGLVTFISMVYIVPLNPLIIGTSKDSTGHFLGGGTAPNLAAVAAATALLAGVMTLVMGLLGRMPFGLATGLGLNAFVTFDVATRMSWADAMGMVVIEGLVITVLVLTGFRQAVFNAVPMFLKSAIAAGIGLFIAIIGFADGGIVRVGSGTVTQLGYDGSMNGWPTLVFWVSLLLIAALMVRQVKGAILISVVISTVLAFIIQATAHVGAFDAKTNPNGWQLNVPSFSGKHFGMPDLSLLGHFSFGGFSDVGVVSGLAIVFALFLSDFFDFMGTSTGLAKEAGLYNDTTNNFPRMRETLFVDGLAAVAGGLASVSSATTYVESSTGIAGKHGARTGLASVVTGLAFVGMVFLAPLTQLVPSEAVAPALVVVGVLLLRQAMRIDWHDLKVGIPAFLTIVGMPFTYSITDGIAWGVISYVVLRLVVGKARGIHPLMWLISVLFLVYFAIEPLKSLLHIS